MRSFVGAVIFGLACVVAAGVLWPPMRRPLGVRFRVPPPPAGTPPPAPALHRLPPLQSTRR